jgi:hypothetical protein
MKAIQSFFFLSIFSLFLSCFGDVPNNQNPNPPNLPDSTTTTEPTDNQTDAEPKPNAVTDFPKCEVAGTVLNGNVFWAKESNLLVCVAANEETKDAELGDSHRVLEIYDGSTCELMEKKVLPINISPDFPYKIADITYNNLNQIVAIVGFNSVYCYNAKTQILSESLTPQFLNERFAEDAQSGMINHIEVWENYLIGYAQDMGTFVFDLSGNTPKNLEPFAEFEISEGELYNSMFLLKSGENAYQIILPQFDFDSEKLSIESLFKEPKNLDTEMNKRYRNNRFIILKEKTTSDQTPIAVDMKTMQKVDLPVEILKKKNTEILEWFKTQKQ